MLFTVARVFAAFTNQQLSCALRYCKPLLAATDAMHRLRALPGD
jgi:hypothetical protein